MIKRDAIIHPLLFALFPMLSLFVNNANRLSFSQVTGAILVVLISTTLLWFLLDLLLKNKRKSAIIVSAFLILFFSYGHLMTAATALLYQLQILDKAGVLVFLNTKVALAWLLLLGTVFGATGYLTVKSSSDLGTPTKAFNIISVFLILSVGANWAIMQVGAGQTRATGDTEPNTMAIDWDFLQQNHLGKGTDNARTVPDSLPDIYYIVLAACRRDSFPPNSI